MKTRDLALVIIFASIYPVLTLTLYPLSYGEIQIRVADALYPLIGIFGVPCLVGCIIGHLIANIFSPLGFLDLLSVAIFVPAKLAIWKWKFKGVPFHVLSVALWVGWMLHYLFGAPLFLTILYVGIGETVAEMVLGRWLYLEIEKRLT